MVQVWKGSDEWFHRYEQMKTWYLKLWVWCDFADKVTTAPCIFQQTGLKSFIIIFKGNRYTCHHFEHSRNFCSFLFVYTGAYFFSFRADPFSQGRQWFLSVASLASASIPLKISCSSQTGSQSLIIFSNTFSSLVHACLCFILIYIYNSLYK